MPQFPSFDISHNSHRSQRDNVARNIRLGGSALPPANAPAQTGEHNAPTNFRMSLESTISYYDQEAATDAHRGVLFKATAGWLREIITLRNSVKELNARIYALEDKQKGDTEIEALVAAEIEADNAQVTE